MNVGTAASEQTTAKCFKQQLAKKQVTRETLCQKKKKLKKNLRGQEVRDLED